MKQLGEFVVDGKVVEVPGNEREEFEQLAKEHATTPDELHSLRVTEADGRSVDVKVPESQREEFERMAEEKGATFEPLRTLELDDGTKKSMTGGEISRHLRIEKYRANLATAQAEQGSVTWAAIKGAIGGFFTGAWAGGNAAANKIAKAIPEIGIEVESAAGNLARFAGKTITRLGGRESGEVIERFGEGVVESAAGAQAWLDEKLPSNVKDWLGYEDWSTKVGDWTSNAAAMAVKFAPGMAKMGAEAFMETIFASDGVNAAARAYDTAIANGQSPEEAAALGGEAFLLNYFGGKALTKAGAWAEGVHGPVKQFLVSGTASSGTMGTQAAGNKMIDNLAEGKPVLEGVAEETGKGFVEGWAFHGYNALPGLITGVAAIRAEHRRREEYARGEILRMVETDADAAKLAMWMDGEALDAAIRARKAAKAGTDGGSGTHEPLPKVVDLAREAGLPETMTPAEINKVLDAVAKQREALANRVRINMDDQQAEALCETVGKVVEAEQSSAVRTVEIDQKELMERTWNRAADKVTDARDMDDPELREKIVKSAAKEVVAEMEKERRAELDEKSRIRGAKVGEQMKILDDRGIATWEDAEAAGLVGKDERGRWSGGARQAVNIAVNGTEALKTAVKDGKIGGDLAEEMITLSHCELGWMPKESREAIIDKVLEAADGNAEMAQWMMEIVGRCDRAELADVDARVRKVADEVAQGMAEQRAAARTTEADVSRGDAEERSVGKSSRSASSYRAVDEKMIERTITKLTKYYDIDEDALYMADVGVIDKVTKLPDMPVPQFVQKVEKMLGRALRRVDDKKQIKNLAWNIALHELQKREAAGEKSQKAWNVKEIVERDKTDGTNLSGVTELVSAMMAKDEQTVARLRGKHFSFAKTSDVLKESGLNGDYFTIKAGVVLRHNGKDAAHTITPEEWVGISRALSEEKPLLVEKRGNDGKSFRIWTRATIGGKIAIVGADVKSTGRNIDVNSIKTAFGAEGATPNIANIVYPKSQEELQSVLTRHDSGRYTVALPTARSIPNNSSRVNSSEGPAPETAYEGAKYAERLKGTELKSIDGGMLGCERFPEVSVEITQEGIRVEGLTDELMSKPENTADTAALLKRLDDISRRTGLEIDLGDANALTVAQGIIEEVKRGSLKEAQRKMDTRAQLFDLLMKTTLGNGVTYDEASFKTALENISNGRRFVDNHGNIYGFKDGDGVLHFNPTVFNYNTPIHEYGHLALESLKGVNPALLKRGMELIKESDYYKEFKERSEKAGDEYSYLKGDEEGICDEALATLIGDRGQRLVDQKGLGAELKAWLKEFWAAIKGAFGIADLTPEQIEKMTLRDFADAMNAELLRGREFGTKKQRPLSEKSIKRYDEAEGSGSNGMLRWKNDRGRLFYIPVDMEKTQPGGKVVLATDDANVTDWIQQRLNGVELRMSKTGKIYVKGSNGLDGELAEIFGRYPKAGQNDGIFEQLASELQNESLREATPDQLVAALIDDRANYDAWLKATADGKTLEALKEEQHWAEEAEREAFEARERFEQSGMGVLDYIRSRAAEEGEAAFDLDWETMRELAREQEEGKFAFGGEGKFAAGKAVAPSALGDGKQRYYEVPFDKAVDKIVKNKKPVSDDHVFVSETPKPFADIGFARLPVMMGQGHIISCYFGEGEGVEGKNLHKMKGNLKLLPKALEKPLMIITSETSPSDSVVAILKMKDNTGASVIVPVKMSGVGRVGKDRVDAHIALTMFGKKNAWKSLVANAIEKEVNGEIGVFYIDGAESKTILERLGDKAKGLGISGLQSPSETKAHRNPENGRSGLQSPSRSISQGTLHSIADADSPVKGGIVSQTATRQFKNWFGGSKVVDANGEPLVVYHATNNDEATSVWDERTKQYLTSHKPFTIFKRKVDGLRNNGHFFTSDRSNAEGYGNTTYACYLNIRNPLVIDCNGSDYSAIKHDGRVLDTYEWAQWAEKNGHDGVIFKNVRDGVDYGAMQKPSDEYVVFSSNQIKSATDNIGTFDPGNNDVRFHAGRGLDGSETIIDASRFVARRTRVAADAGVGEQTPGAIAASRELATQGTTPISQLGQFRKMSLPLSELLVLQQKLTGSAMPGRILAERSWAIRTGQWGSHTKAWQIAIQADLLGMVDGTDMAKEKETLKQHGFYLNEDSQWLANHSQAEIRAEQRRSEDQLATQIINLAKRRTQGTAMGGGSAARRVFADQVAKYVMDMPQNLGGTLGRVQTVGRGVRADVRARFSGDATAAKSEAGDFLDWAYGAMPTDAQGNPVRRAEAMSLDDLTSSMFGSWLVMPQEVERRAPKWDEAFTAAIAADARLLEAFKELSVRAFTEQSHTHVELKIEKQLSRQVEEAIKKLEVERTEEISAGSKLADKKETILVGLHDKFAPVYVRVDEKLKAYRAAKKQLLKRTASAVDRAAIRAEIDRFEGEMAAKMHKLELSRTAFERGAWNEGRRYWMEMARLDNDATGRWGLEQKDISLYLELQRVIETQGRSGSFGQSPQQARLSLGDMARRLGAAKWARMEEYSRRFHDIIMREIYDDPRVERALGSGVVNYFRSQSHYVTTKRTFSPEELDAIETARAQARAAGVAGGDDVITEMYKYAGSCGAGDVAGIGAAGWTAALKGSFAAKQEVRSATWMKHDGLMQFARRNQMILDLRDALVTSGVEGVRELPAAKGAEFPDNKRYGHLTFMENGQKRVLVVPKQIAEAFKVDPDLARWITKANGWVRKALIDYNVAYWAQNIKRNQDSIEKNVQGMRETYLKTLLRATGSGASPIMDLTLQALVRNVPKTAVLFNDHTVFAFIPKAERYARILEDLSGWQKELWAAEDAHDAAKVTRMYDDYAGVMEMLKGNFLTPTSAAYAGGDTTHGFVFDAMNRKGMKTLAQIEEESQGDKKWSKFVRKVNVFRMNAAQQEHEEILAKTIAYLHDRAHYSMERSVAESGLMVKKNVSIAEGERKGRLARPVQQAMAQFYNMVEKGVTRHWRNYKERPGEMLVKDGKVWIGRAMGMMLANGAARAWMLADSDGDEEKARQKYGLVYDYAAAYHTAWKNCSSYVKENYNFTPIWNSKDGFTSVIFGGALTDEDKLIVPTADFVANMAAHKMGVGPKPEIGKTLANATFKAVTPDLALASPVMNFLRSTVEAALIDNPTDYFRGAPMYDQSLWEVRNESWEMRGKFAAAVGAKLFGDYGGRAILAPDIYGVDNGRGNAPETVEVVLRKIPVMSPAIARMVKIQVGSPAKHGEAITEEAKRRRAIIDVCAKDLMRQVDANGVDIWERDPQGYERQLATWKERYRLNDLDVMRLRVKYLNGARQRKNRAGFDQKELGKLMKEAARMGMTKEQFWLELGEM